MLNFFFEAGPAGKLCRVTSMLSSHNSDPEGPEDPGDPNGKTLEEITAWCTEYDRKQRKIRVERQRAGIEGTYHAAHMFLSYMH